MITRFFFQQTTVAFFNFGRRFWLDYVVNRRAEEIPELLEQILAGLKGLFEPFLHRPRLLDDIIRAEGEVFLVGLFRFIELLLAQLFAGRRDGFFPRNLCI